jgi:glucosamine--fructose-6-phosphate aminotransferase (isomerizing)
MKRMNESYTYTEIKTQPQAWQNALDVAWAAAPAIKALTDRYNQVLFSGCGSTYYLSLAGAALFQKMTGKNARAVPGSELLFNTAAVVDQKSPCLLIAISRSGTTSETVKAVEQFKKARLGEVIVVSNYDTTLSTLADLSIIIPAGQEFSVAQTRSYASMLVAVTALCAIAAGRNELRSAMDELPGLGQHLLEKYESLAQEVGENLNYDRFYFLGSGTRYGLASEVSLKMKEMTLTHSEPFYFDEFRHGPMSMVGESTVVVGLLSAENFAQEQAVLDEMQALGASILALSESHADVEFHSAIPEEVRGVLYLPVLQLMAFHRSLAKGLNPDSPQHLSAVVTLNL